MIQVTQRSSQGYGKLLFLKPLIHSNTHSIIILHAPSQKKALKQSYNDAMFTISSDT